MPYRGQSGCTFLKSKIYRISLVKILICWTVYWCQGPLTFHFFIYLSLFTKSAITCESYQQFHILSTHILWKWRKAISNQKKAKAKAKTETKNIYNHIHTYYIYGRSVSIGWY